MKFVVLVLLVTVLAATPVAAQGPDDGFWTPRTDYVRLLSDAAQKADLERQISLLEQRLEIEKEKTAGLRDLVALEREKATARAELAQIQQERAEYWKSRVEEVEAHARKETRRARTAAGCATGALAGTVTFPGLGTVVGLGIGCAAGFLLQ